MSVGPLVEALDGYLGISKAIWAHVVFVCILPTGKRAIVRNITCNLFACNINCDDGMRAGQVVYLTGTYSCLKANNNATDSCWWFNNGSTEGPHYDNKKPSALLFISNKSMNNWRKCRFVLSASRNRSYRRPICWRHNPVKLSNILWERIDIEDCSSTRRY